jgi:hypothetical protein
MTSRDIKKVPSDQLMPHVDHLVSCASVDACTSNIVIYIVSSRPCPDHAALLISSQVFRSLPLLIIIARCSLVRTDSEAQRHSSADLTSCNSAALFYNINHLSCFVYHLRLLIRLSQLLTDRIKIFTTRYWERRRTLPQINHFHYIDHNTSSQWPHPSPP